MISGHLIVYSKVTFNAEVENRLEDMGRGKGKLGRSESGMDIYTLPNVK